MNGVTGRMGTNQHLVRSILAIREQGGIAVGAGEALWPEPMLVGRDERKLAALAEPHGLERWTTDLAQALDEHATSTSTPRSRAAARTCVRAAIDAGKHVYCEKPLTEDLDAALALARAADDGRHQARRRAGQAVPPRPAQAQAAARQRRSSGACCRVRGEFGYWVFPGPDPAPQRPSWNYRARGRRRDHRRHVRPLALRARRAVRRRSAACSRYGATHIPVRASTSRARRTTRPPRTRPTRCSSSTAARSRR